MDFEGQFIRFDFLQRARESPTRHAKIAKNMLDEPFFLPYGGVGRPILPRNVGLTPLRELQQLTKAQGNTVRGVLICCSVAHLDSSRDDSFRRGGQERRLRADVRRRGFVKRRFARVQSGKVTVISV